LSPYSTEKALFSFLHVFRSFAKQGIFRWIFKVKLKESIPREILEKYDMYRFIKSFNYLKS
jgi:hypothetical protein